MRSRKIKIRLAVIVLILLLITVYFFTVAGKIVTVTCADEVKARVINIINDANDVLRTYHFFYENFFQVERNSLGDVDVISANAALINQVNMLIQTDIQNRLNILREIDIYLPAGVLTGSALFSSFGVPIKFRVRVTANCAPVIRSVFEGMRINQTLHRLQIDCIATIKITAPFGTATQEALNEITIAETIIIGKVPSTYFATDGSVPNNIYDLLPMI